MHGLTEAVEPPGLRSLAGRQNFGIGTAVALSALGEDVGYKELLSREFNVITAENAMKFRHLQPQADRFDFVEADQLVAFARQNRMQVRGHTLVWHNALPDWLKERTWTRAEAIALLETHIKTVVGHYRGQVVAWDVVNEAIEDDGRLRDSFWLENIGPEYIEMAFRWAHEADPDALLIYNDYGGEGLNQKSDAIYRLLQYLVRADVPVQGVGMQMHVAVDSPPNSQAVASNMERLSELGLQVQITEMDVRIRQTATPQDLEKQAQVYQSMLETCLSAANCNLFTIWGASDRYSWVPSHFTGWGDALPFDHRLLPKPAYWALLEVFRGVQN